MASRFRSLPRWPLCRSLRGVARKIIRGIDLPNGYDPNAPPAYMQSYNLAMEHELRGMSAWRPARLKERGIMGSL